MKFLFVLFYLLVGNLYAKDFIYLLGAGGEELGNVGTVFDDAIAPVSHFYNSIHGKKELGIYFNGGHSQTDRDLKKYFPPSALKGSFTQKNYQLFVRELIAKIKKKSSEFDVGSKILIGIYSHGEEKTADVFTHAIATNDPDDQVSLDLLKELADLTSAKGIKLAIIDGSCHSGNTLALANKHTCVISAASKNQYATIFFPDFFKNLAPGKNLESVFLQTRKEGSYSSFPLISSPAGRQLERDFELFLPLLYYNDHTGNGDEADKITPYLTSDWGSDKVCAKSDDDFEYINFTKNLYKLLPMIPTEFQAKAEELRKLVNEKEGIHRQYRKELKKLHLSMEDFNHHQIFFTKSGKKVEYSLREILEMDFALIIAGKQNAKSKEEMEEKDLLLALAQVQDELKKNPNYRQFLNLKSRIKKETLFTEEQSILLGQKSLELYESLYYKYSKELKELNPCRDFSF